MIPDESANLSCSLVKLDKQPWVTQHAQRPSPNLVPLCGLALKSHLV